MDELSSKCCVCESDREAVVYRGGIGLSHSPLCDHWSWSCLALSPVLRGQLLHTLLRWSPTFSGVGPTITAHLYLSTSVKSTKSYSQLGNDMSSVGNMNSSFTMEKYVNTDLIGNFRMSCPPSSGNFWKSNVRCFCTLILKTALSPEVAN